MPFCLRPRIKSDKRVTVISDNNLEYISRSLLTDKQDRSSQSDVVLEACFG